MEKLKTDVFIERSKLVFGERYDYSKTRFINSKTKVCIVCKKHGCFWQYPNNHLKGKECLRCSYEKRGGTNSKNTIASRYKNISQPSDYKLIPLNNGFFAKVDNSDFDTLKTIVWTQIGGRYAFNNKYKQMHRFIMNPPINMVIDHINGDGFDNRSCNLRVCTSQQNTWNSRPTHGDKKGYYYSKKIKKWVAEITLDRKKISIGRYTSREEAEAAYCAKAIEVFGEYAYCGEL